MSGDGQSSLAHRTAEPDKPACASNAHTAADDEQVQVQVQWQEQANHLGSCCYLMQTQIEIHIIIFGFLMGSCQVALLVHTVLLLSREARSKGAV